MKNLKYWINNIADMPEKNIHGKWIDRETGLAYNSNINYEKEFPAFHGVSKAVKRARSKSNFLGGKALKGTSKQVKQAEDIRAGKIEYMTEDQAAECCRPDGLLSSAKVWIENRNRSPREFFEFISTAKSLREQYAAAQASSDAVTVAKVAAAYNALTAAWGL